MDAWSDQQFDEFYHRISIRADATGATKQEAQQVTNEIDAKIPDALHGMMIGLVQSTAELEIEHGDKHYHRGLDHSRSALMTCAYILALAEDLDAEPEVIRAVAYTVARQLVDMARASLGRPR